MAALDDLAATSYAVAQLSECEARTVQQAVASCSELLRRGREGGSCGRGSSREDDEERLVLSLPYGQAIVAHWQSRSQIRVERLGRERALQRLGRWAAACCGGCCSRGPAWQSEEAQRCPGHAETEALEHLERAWDVLAAVAARHLPPHLGPLLPRPAGREAPTESIIDAFYYPRPTAREAPCPAHEDPGVLTVIADDAPGLEVRDAGGAWRPLALRPSDVALVVGRSWAGCEALCSNGGRPCRACMHRVCPQGAAARCSVAFEVRLSREGQL
eukprot:CAMPEP_0179055814 /NCGR_PEP_ID=MMETSP0796-20121207/23494_1 /TAXON_ID=73915 /ORGANISM="Pyrodinium bahamense, Strain pbaha01" /LENGTH=272 /DNA_ID=CAMNT_0020752477 /DNA_START=60 /DNA_END=875 /DNA_ORIENTATION=-